MSIIVSMLSQGANLYQTTSEMTNAAPTDFFSAGVVGTVGNTSGVAPTTGVWGLNANGTPNNTVIANSGTGYVTATPTGQASQLLRVKASTTTTITIAANATGSTVYDWIYMQISASAAIAPAVDGTGVASFVTSRSTSNSTDTGTPPSFGLVVGIVTVANGFSTITNGNITDKRVQAGVSGVATNVVTNTNLETSIRPQTRWSESFFDYIASGCVWTGDNLGATLVGSMTAGVVYVGGVRSTVAAVTAHAFTLSKDTYVYVDNTGAVSYNAVTNNAASPALPANSVLIAIVVTGATSIANANNINQGQVTATAPAPSSNILQICDSLGNLIGNRAPRPVVLGRRGYSWNAPGGTSTANPIVGSSLPVIVLAGRNIRLSSQSAAGQTDFSTNYALATFITEVGVGDITNGYGFANGSVAGTNNATPFTSSIVAPTAGTHTYGARVQISTANLTGGSGWITAELV